MIDQLLLMIARARNPMARRHQQAPTVAHVTNPANSLLFLSPLPHYSRITPNFCTPPRCMFSDPLTTFFPGRCSCATHSARRLSSQAHRKTLLPIENNHGQANTNTDTLPDCPRRGAYGCLLVCVTRSNEDGSYDGLGPRSGSSRSAGPVHGCSGAVDGPTDRGFGKENVRAIERREGCTVTDSPPGRSTQHVRGHHALSRL
jgi:hypothetical protein